MVIKEDNEVNNDVNVKLKGQRYESSLPYTKQLPLAGFITIVLYMV